MNNATPVSIKLVGHRWFLNTALLLSDEIMSINFTQFQHNVTVGLSHYNFFCSLILYPSFPFPHQKITILHHYLQKRDYFRFVYIISALVCHYMCPYRTLSSYHVINGNQRGFRKIRSLLRRIGEWIRVQSVVDWRLYYVNISGRGTNSIVNVY